MALKYVRAADRQLHRHSSIATSLFRIYYETCLYSKSLLNWRYSFDILIFFILANFPKILLVYCVFCTVLNLVSLSVLLPVIFSLYVTSQFCDILENDNDESPLTWSASRFCLVKLKDLRHLFSSTEYYSTIIGRLQVNSTEQL